MARTHIDGLRIDAEDRWLVENFKWRKRSDGYVIRSVYLGWIDGGYRYKRIYLHRIIVKAGSGEIVDHINGDPLDNRRCNLRVVTQHINMQNSSRRLHARNTSGYRGVFWDKRKQKWMARAKLSGHQYFIGYYDTVEQAGNAAHEWRLLHMPGYGADVDPDAIAHYRSLVRPQNERKRKKLAPSLCPCGCGRPVRNPNRARFAHGGRPARPHGVLPPSCKIDVCDKHLLIGHAWHLTSNGYVASRISNKIVLLHRLIMQAPQNLVVDHINGDRLDNRRSNLRLTTHKLNSQNVGLSSQNTSGYRGITWDAHRGKWAAQARLGARTVHIGRFDAIEDAVEASRRWREANMPGYRPERDQSS